MDSDKVKINVSVKGITEMLATAERLSATLNEAKTLADALASEADEIEVCIS